MNKWLTILFVVLLGTNSFGQTPQILIDSINGLIRKHELYPEFKTTVSLKDGDITISNVSTQTFSFALKDISSVKYLNSYLVHSVKLYCKDTGLLITEKFKGNTNKLNSVSVVLNGKQPCIQMIGYFKELMRLHGHNLSETNEMFDNDLAAISFQIKCKGELNGICYYGVDTLVSGEIILKYPNGEKRLQLQLKDGICDGKQITWYDNGQIESIENYDKGYRNGEFITYWDNGQLATKGTYQSGQEQGVFEQWNEAGIKTLEEHFANGELTMSKAWDESGVLIDELKY